MASKSDFRETGTHRHGLIHMPAFPKTLASQRTTNLSVGGMLSLPSSRRRSAVKGEMPDMMKRAESSPNVRNLANLDTAMISSAERKRNKLGYHRTAVACVHCRRRKIRCIIALDDPGLRCHNCVRLKKECKFHPVDQQSDAEKRTMTSAKPDESMNASPISDTSPPLASLPWDHAETHAGHHQPLNVIPDGAGHFSFESVPMPSSEDSGISSASYSSSSLFSKSSWSSTPIVTSPLETIETAHFLPSHPTYWHPHVQPDHPLYEPCSYPGSAISAPMQSAPPEHFSHFPNVPLDEAFTVPQIPYHSVRSMSLAPEDLPNFHASYHTDSRILLPPHPTNGADINLPSLSRSTNHTPPCPDMVSTPGIYAYEDHPPLSSTFHLGASLQSPLIAASGSEVFAPWYSAPVALADVKEEEDEVVNMHYDDPISSRL